MLRLLLTMGALATTSGIVAGISTATAEPPAPPVEIIGQEHPLFLGSTVVTATAPPDETR